MRGCRTAPRIDVLQPLMPQQGPHCSRMPRLTGRTAVREKMRKPQAVDYLYSYSQSLTLKLSVTPSASPPLPATLKLLPSLSEFAFQHTHTHTLMGASSGPSPSQPLLTFTSRWQREPRDSCHAGCSSSTHRSV